MPGCRPPSFMSNRRSPPKKVEGLGSRLIQTASHLFGSFTQGNESIQTTENEEGEDEKKTSSVVRVWRRWRRGSFGSGSDKNPVLKKGMTKHETQEHFRRIQSEHISSKMGPILAL